jgi:hypothetical protein
MAQAQQPAVSPDHRSTQRTAATTAAGLCYLAVIAGGLFAEGAVRSALIVPGDPAATAKAILQNEALWRLGIAVHLGYLVPALAMKLIVSGLFRSIEPMLARGALVFGVAAVTIEAVALVTLFVPLVLLENEGAALALIQNASALIYLATRLFAVGFGFSLMLFAGFCVLVGFLILRTRLLPGVIGAMMIVAGVCYVVNTLALILSPSLFELLNPMILLPIVIGEMALALWLLLKGVAVVSNSR